MKLSIASEANMNNSEQKKMPLQKYKDKGETKNQKKARKKTRCFVAGDAVPFPTFEFQERLYVSGFDIHSSTKHKKNVKIDNEYRSITEVLKRKGMVVVFLSRELREEMPKDLHCHITCNKSGKFVPLEEITRPGGKFHEYLVKRMAYKFSTEPAFVIKKCTPQKEVKKRRAPAGEGKANKRNKSSSGIEIPQAVAAQFAPPLPCQELFGNQANQTNQGYVYQLGGATGGSLFDLIDAINKEEATQQRVCGGPFSPSALSTK